ncbi:hypothetical protein PENTCL1PPCAC_16501 [Pristionchus entomophagus]|uniref:CRAL-TRIO domain-containing protein n=1 Tax=Pristionchus entomophagus TaxID=358040 RepID=A0AAV5TJ66_9BILA|nr:hypothetical protein PENTCL1PPCAC_16501 [Pristionchus entomophagus]
MPTDEETVAELRSLVSDHLTPYYDTHFNLLRWIQGYPGVSIEKIAQRLRHHLILRSSCAWEVDSMHEKEKRSSHPLHSHWPIVNIGKSGIVPNTLVLIEQCGYIDYVEIFNRLSVPEIVKAKLHDAEATLHSVMEMEKETGEQASVIVVVDAEGIDYSKGLIDLVRGPMNTLSGFLLQHYVELASVIVVVNVPSWASTLWAMVKPLLPENSRMKLRILSSSNWREEIGTLVDPSGCPTFWNDSSNKEFQLVVERPMQLPPRSKPAVPTEKLEKLQVKAGQVHWMEYRLEQGDALTFRISSSANCGFTIVRAHDDDESDVFAMRTVFPLFPLMHGPVKMPIEDTVIAPESGTYKVWISNTRAWWSSLTIHHSIKVTKNNRS